MSSKATRRKHPVFNRTDRVTEGWYWALASKELRRGQVRALNLMGKELVIFRGESGRITAMDAYCPHMGAHLAEGRVDGDGLRCFFHHWKFDESGTCVDVPCQSKPPVARNRTYSTAEHYGMIWLWTGEGEPRPLPVVPELDGEETDVAHANRFVKNCHPNVVLINAIDAQHFYSVHNLPNVLEFETDEVDDATITLRNARKVPDTSALWRLFGRFYADALTYSMTYYNGSTGTVTLGPDFMHFHIMFAFRMGPDGTAEGQTITVTKKRKGLSGRLFNKAVLHVTNAVGNYFASGDTKVFSTIKFDLKTPVKADKAVIDFIRHLDKQKTVPWSEDDEAEAAVEAGVGDEPSEEARSALRRLPVIRSTRSA